MPARLPLRQAVETARRLFAPGVGSNIFPSPSGFIESVRQFERVAFEVPETVDADGFAFQAGRVNWLSEPTFVIGVTRQLEAVDVDGAHDSYLQVAMEFRYALDRDLETMDSVSRWWFRGYSDDFSAWLEAVESDEIWQRVAGKDIREFVVLADEI